MTNGRFVCGSAVLLIAATAMLRASPAAAQCTPVTGGQPGVCTCVMGPVTVEAPVCEITSEDLGETRDEYVQWQESGGIFYTVISITPKRRVSIRGYVARWRHHHKCTAKERPFGSPSRFQGKASTRIPPQTNWTGVCAGGDSYIARAVAAGKQVVEIQVARRRGVPNGTSQVELLFPGLLDRVRLTKPPRR